MSLNNLHFTNFSIRNGCAVVKFHNLKHNSKPPMSIFMFIAAKPNTVKTNT